MTTVDLPTSPPQSLARIPSAASTVPSSMSSSQGGVTSPGLNGGSERKKRARNLLRDYYGLAGTEKKGDPMDIDSPVSFNPDLYFNSLSASASLPELLKRENDLINEIRELDGERQSLVYNHHHELIEASDTIRKMRSRALALDGSLESLKLSFESISQLSASLSSSSSPSDSSPSSPRPRTPPGGRRLASFFQASTRLAALPEAEHSPPPPVKGLPKGAFDPLVHLPALLALPLLLRNAERAKADGLWGQWEPVLRSWEEAGVDGVQDVARECREALKIARGNNATTTTNWK